MNELTEKKVAESARNHSQTSKRDIIATTEEELKDKETDVNMSMETDEVVKAN